MMFPVASGRVTATPKGLWCAANVAQAYHHPKWIEYGLYREYIVVHPKIVFYLLQDGFIHANASCKLRQAALEMGMSQS